METLQKSLGQRFGAQYDVVISKISRNKLLFHGTGELQLSFDYLIESADSTQISLGKNQAPTEEIVPDISRNGEIA